MTHSLAELVIGGVLIAPFVTYALVCTGHHRVASTFAPDGQFRELLQQPAARIAIRIYGDSGDIDCAVLREGSLERDRPFNASVA